MISAAETKSNEMAASSTFSYAQAAKGQGASPSTALPSLAPQAQGAALSVGASDTPREVSDAPRSTDSRPLAAVEKQDIDSNMGSESDLRSETTHDRRSESRRDDDSGRLDRPWRRTDKGTRSSSTTTRSIDEQESRKPRKGKKSKASSDKQSNDQAADADKDKEAAQPVVKVELSEAPIPSVNIWHQRKEQQSKAKPSLAESATNGTSGLDGETKKSTKDSASPSSTKENAPANGVKSNRKNGDSARPERNGSRGSRLAEKDGKTELPPPVEDAASWPTPEIAIKEEQKKPAATKSAAPAPEKEPQDDGSQNKRSKDKWVTYDYVPSVNFETQLPQMRNSKPRGGARGANSGRTAPTGAQATDKAAANATPSKPAESKDRAKDNVAGSTKNTSLLPAAKRGPVDANTVAKEQKKAASQPGNDKAKDITATQPANTSNNRSDARAERGRGGYRGRGAHHSVNSHAQHQHNGANTFSNNGSLPGRPQGPYSPPPRQGPHGFMPPPQRGGRGRNGASNNFHRMSLPNGASRLPPIQAQFGSYEYPMPPVSAMSYQQPPFWDNMVMAVLKNQIEYYFSIENLCKDVYLRKRMDSQGFVDLHFITAFKRIRELTSDMGMIRAVCESSDELDFVVGEDDGERLRRRDGWHSFILPMEDRDDFARNAGPRQLTFKNGPFAFGSSHFNGAVPVPYGVPPPVAFSPQGDAQFQHYPEGVPTGQPVNGLVNGNDGSHSSTQLSADVPDFSPGGLAGQGPDAPNHQFGLPNGLTNGVHAE